MSISFIFSFIVLILLIFYNEFLIASESFSFQKFSGPVSGRTEKIVVDGPYGQKVDYMAKPDYRFHYGVQDDETGNSLAHKESRNGNNVIGEYRVLQDDGIVRIVRYTADAEHGFQAHIEYKRLRDSVR